DYYCAIWHSSASYIF
nr:immunoglobulin light chain junction region [Macaca mulatta]MOV68088.1 immunoglobulin light chain junction region [Macaca mulatta]MOV68521.1 immunoglobulin light chain junction region [Macaca mulatta]MOV70370.1 immunoglobulin light chain junction region [Macaca mulatta]MOV70418.1 immunoglobulin light chain junction region [Macaca mulatta]